MQHQPDLSIFRQFVERSSVGYEYTDLKGRLIYTNPAFRKMIGEKRIKDVNGKHVGAWYPRETKKKLVDKIFPAVLKKGRWAGELPLKSRNGNIIAAVHDISLVKDGDGNPQYFCSCITDINQQKKSEQELMKDRDLIEKYLNVVKVVILGLDANKKVILINDRGCEILGYDRDQIIGKNWFNHFLPRRLRREVGQVADELFKGSIDPAEYYENPILTREGEERLIAWHNIVLRDEAGEIVTLLSSGEDITERKKIEEQLLRLSRAVEQSSEGLAVIDLKGHILFVNHAFASLHGYTPDEVMGEDLSIFHTPEQMPSVKKANRQIQKTGEFSGEIWHVRKDGTEFPAWMHNSIMKDEKGNPVGIIGTLEDITGQKQAQEIIRESRKKYQAMFETSKSGMALCRMDGSLIECNQAYFDIIGYTEKETLTLSYWDLTPSEYADQEEEQLRSLRTKGQYGPYEKEYIRKGGKRVPVLLNGALIKGADGQDYIWSVVQDITDRKNSEIRVLQERDFSDAVLNSLPGIFYMFNQEGRFLRWNKNLEMVTGYSPDEIKKAHPLDFFEGSDKKLIKKRIQDVFENGYAGVEASLVAKSGRAMPHYFNSLTITVDGKPCLIGTGIDITERKRYEESLRRAMIEKETLLKEVHHRVKNNLLTLYSLVNLQQISLGEKVDAAGALEDMKQRISAMGRVHRMLYLSRNFSRINFADYIEALLSEITATFSHEDKVIDITTDLEPVTFNIDVAIPCGLIINELLMNAFKHAFPEQRTGLIHVSLKKRKKEFELKISDNGVGMENSPLSQDHKTLGLKLVIMLCQQLKAKIAFKGDQGSLFTIAFKSATINTDKEQMETYDEKSADRR